MEYVKTNTKYEYGNNRGAGGGGVERSRERGGGGGGMQCSRKIGLSRDYTVPMIRNRSNQHNNNDGGSLLLEYDT